MASMSERISMVEKELQKYNLKKSKANSLRTISSNISDRISILNGVHSELVSISEELYYYDMVDYVGNVKIEALKLGQCTSLAKELENAKQRFVADKDGKYMHLCDKLHRRVFWAGACLGKEQLKSREPSAELQDFYRCSPEEIRQKLRKCYFGERRKCMAKIVRECSENLEKTYQLLILGELSLYEQIFGEKPQDRYDGRETKLEDLGGFDRYIYETFGLIFNRKNESVARSIVENNAQQRSHSLEDRIFSVVFSVYVDSKAESRRAGRCITIYFAGLQPQPQMGATKQFIFLRNDLPGYGTGALVAQGSHASVAAVQLFYSHRDTKAYLGTLGDMTTIVYQTTGSEMSRLKDELEHMGVGCVEWTEGPTPTCISTRPVDVESHQDFVALTKRFRLFR